MKIEKLIISIKEKRKLLSINKRIEYLKSVMQLDNIVSVDNKQSFSVDWLKKYVIKFK